MKLPEYIKIGDAIHKIALPIAKTLKLGCVDELGNLKPESPCAKRREWLNNLSKKP